MIDDAYREHARFVWGVCYRMTGSAADADDLVQETFARAIASPPARFDEPLRPWLVRVAVNLARDRFRRRRRAPYVGPWLPSPVDTGDEAADARDVDEPGPEARYGMLESVSYAFLLACEALTPRQRAVLLLRDVLDYSVDETARALDLSEANVKTTLHRARAAMKAYDAAREPPTRATQEKTRVALERFAMLLASGDTSGVEAMLAPESTTVTDAAGDYRAALRVVHGASRVARFYVGLMRKTAATGAEMRMVNGLPALVVTVAPHDPRVAPRVVIRVDLDAEGRIAHVHTILARAKLAGLVAA